MDLFKVPKMPTCHCHAQWLNSSHHNTDHRGTGILAFALCPSPTVPLILLAFANWNEHSTSTIYVGLPESFVCSSEESLLSYSLKF